MSPEQSHYTCQEESNDCGSNETSPIVLCIAKLITIALFAVTSTQKAHLEQRRLHPMAASLVDGRGVPSPSSDDVSPSLPSEISSRSSRCHFARLEAQQEIAQRVLEMRHGIAVFAGNQRKDKSVRTDPRDRSGVAWRTSETFMNLRRPMAPDFAPRSPVLKLRTTPSPRGPGITIMSTVQELSVRGRSSLTHCGGCRLSILSGTLPSKLCRSTQQHCSVVSECTQLRWLEKLVEADDKNEFHRTRSTRRLLNVWPRAVRHAFPHQTFLSGTCPSLMPVFVTFVGRGEGKMRFATGRGEGWIRTWLEQSTVAKNTFMCGGSVLPMFKGFLAQQMQLQWFVTGTLCNRWHARIRGAADGQVKLLLLTIFCVVHQHRPVAGGTLCGSKL